MTETLETHSFKFAWKNVKQIELEDNCESCMFGSFL
jgi:hypothetical protein